MPVSLIHWRTLVTQHFCPESESSQQHQIQTERSAFAEIWDKFREVQKSHLGAARQLELPEENGLGVFLNHVGLRLDVLATDGGGREELSEVLRKLEDIKRTIREGLVDETRRLISEVFIFSS